LARAPPAIVSVAILLEDEMEHAAGNPVQMDHVRLEILHDARAVPVLPAQGAHLPADECFAEGERMHRCSLEVAELMPEARVAVRDDLAPMAPLFQRANQVPAKDFQAADLGPERIGPDQDAHVSLLGLRSR
jgi:hypothetical protein